ncbi:hypothetical protein SOV_36260 [Sporomusa ovata DSM 2662]|uniref:Uncharacterized protein n=1 Tax=Sporomusa ovata TaxID=2378 RepID=A0A0U1L5Z4_9FIRM|nr:hypothetical protein [Sporomusa ovata]EQB24775.1 hypothetical protein SOV_6c01890 [Sporomusa ovata DSM 2662]CQR75121.1 conserved hypothetical protein [Sporomusa ovata]
MIYVTNTPNNAGVAIYGDCLDFDALYEALHVVVGDEDEYVRYEASRIRVLGVCYDLRHALMGDREVEFVDNGMDKDKMRNMAIIAHDKNIYLKINVLWPELLFVTMALNDFVRLHAEKQAKNSYHVMLDKRNIWDESISNTRLFQAAIAKSLKETVSPHSFNRMMNLLNHDYTWTDGYITQYLDVLNIKFINMDKEKRLKSIPTMAKRLTEHGKEYLEIESVVLEGAKEFGRSANDVRLKGIDYPDEIDW